MNANTNEQIAKFYGAEVVAKLNAAHKVTRPSLQVTIDTCEIMFWLAFSNIIGLVVATGIYNVLVSGRIF